MSISKIYYSVKSQLLKIKHILSQPFSDFEASDNMPRQINFDFDCTPIIRMEGSGPAH